MPTTVNIPKLVNGEIDAAMRAVAVDSWECHCVFYQHWLDGEHRPICVYRCPNHDVSGHEAVHA